MSKTSKAKSELFARLRSLLGEPDHYGNFKWEQDGRQFRFKLNKTSWRYEKGYGGRWGKIMGAYYTDIKSNGLVDAIIRIRKK